MNYQRANSRGIKKNEKKSWYKDIKDAKSNLHKFVYQNQNKRVLDNIA